MHQDILILDTQTAYPDDQLSLTKSFQYEIVTYQWAEDEGQFSDEVQDGNN